MRWSLFGLFMLAFLFVAIAQDDAYPFPSLSPKGVIHQQVGNTTIQIEYERPSVRKRPIFGGLVPWGKVWRTGAGYCTRISFDRVVVVGGQKVEAGKYALLTIPGPEEWVVILNRDTTLYGSYNYNEDKDAARFIVLPTESNRFYETLNFDIEILPNDGRVFLNWANTQISFDIETTTDDEVERLIDELLLTKKHKDTNIYAGATEYLFFRGDNLLNAIKLADTAIELDEHNGWARSLKIKIYERLKQYEKALVAIEAYRKYALSRNWENEQEKANTFQFLEEEYLRISELK